MAKKKQKKTSDKAKSERQVDTRKLAIGGAAIAGGIGLIALGLSLRARGSFDAMFPSADDVDGDDSPGTIDRALGMPSEGAGELGGAAARAPDEFRPDPTAPVSEDKRDAFAPATLPNPNQTTPAM